MEKKVSTTADRLLYLMQINGLTQGGFLRRCEPYCQQYNVKLGRNAMCQYLQGKVLPKQDKLFIFGKAFNVSEAWLMGFDVPMNKNDTSNTPNRKIPYQVEQWLSEIGDVEFSDDEIAEIINYAKFMISKRKA